MKRLIALVGLFVFAAQADELTQFVDENYNKVIIAYKISVGCRNLANKVLETPTEFRPHKEMLDCIDVMPEYEDWEDLTLDYYNFKDLSKYNTETKERLRKFYQYVLQYHENRDYIYLVIDAFSK